MRDVAPLRAFGRADLVLAGGKGANLGELLKTGFRVPDGFVITTQAYAVTIESADLHSALKEDDGAALRASFEAVTIPEALRRAIADAYAALGGGPVAVRSSATAEDLPGAAFAGQMDTYLNVVGAKAVIDAVRRCWASLWTDRAIAYRRKLGIESEEVGMAVVVQRMVEADVAGVLFTANPVTGDRGQMVLDASSGLGEAVVSGLVTPDHYVLDSRGRVRSWSPGRGEVVIRSRAHGGVTHDAGGGHAERLPDAVVRDLAGLGTDVARLFGRPQDIEWAYADGCVWLLQARPLTALPPPPVRVNRVQRRLSSVLIELLPFRPYPLDMTTWLPDGPAGLMAQVAAHFGIRGTFEGMLLEVDGVVDRFVPPFPRPTLGALKAPFRFAALARRHDPGRWLEDPRVANYLAHVRDLARQDLVTLPWHQLIRVPRQALDLVQPITDLRIDYLPRTGRALLRLLLALRLLRRTSLLGDLILGAPTRTGAANRALEALAERVREDPRLTDAVDHLDPQRLSAFSAFSADFEAFLAEYGHRETASPILMSSPTWGECPEIVLGLIKVLADKPRAAAVDRADQAKEALLEHPLLRGPRSRARMERWIQDARWGMAFREDSHFFFTMPLPLLRRGVLEIGRRLRDAGVLNEPEDVLHLRLPELEDIEDLAALTESDKHKLRAAVLDRSARREELSGVPLIDPRLIFGQRDSGDALVSGTPASGGMVKGPVKVIHEPAEFAKLAGGDVLVCPYTNPSWTPLFQRAAAVVVDSGGPASHAAIVAREYGIPAVMGTVNGTTVLTDGQVVTVDGYTGRVTSDS